MFNLFQREETVYTNESYTQFKCPKCGNIFELENLNQGSKYQVTCPKCNKKFPHKTKLTDVTLPKNYATFIDSNKDLVIQKRLKGIVELSYAFVGLFACILPAVLHNISLSADSYIFIIYCGIIALIFAPTGVCGLIDFLFNTREIRVGSDFLKIFIRPYPLLRKDHFYTSDEIEQIYCNEYYQGKCYYHALIALMKNGKKITLIKPFYNLKEARALEILIEKRLGIHDRPVKDEKLQEHDTMIPFFK